MAARTTEARMALLNSKIEKKKASIEKLEAEIKDLENQKYKLEHPVTMKTVMAKAKEAGLSPEDIVEKLGLEM